MRANTFGTHFQVSTFGESHGPAMGALIEGVPAGVPFSWDLIEEKMKERRPGYFPWLSTRKEPDIPELLSGVFEGKTTGTPLALLVRNKDAKPKDYDLIKNFSRAGHCDDLWKEKFKHVDYRGGGRASGRETVGRVLGGAVAQMFVKFLYKDLNILAFASRIGPIERKDVPQSFSKQKFFFGSQTNEVTQLLQDYKSKGMSCGGVVEVWIDHPPIGLGQPVFRKLKSDLASAFMGIGACFFVSLGKKDISLVEGSVLHGRKDSSHYAGIRGGLSTGERIVFELKFKAPSSVLDVAKTGRHDPCIVPRALVVVESMAWLVMADHILWSRMDRLK